MAGLYSVWWRVEAAAVLAEGSVEGVDSEAVRGRWTSAVEDSEDLEEHGCQPSVVVLVVYSCPIAEQVSVVLSHLVVGSGL